MWSRAERRARGLAALAVCALLASACATHEPRLGALPPSDEAFLDDLARRALLYFVEHSDARTGLVRDRARAGGAPVPGADGDVASVAASGFGLAALCIGAERGYLPRDEARARARVALRFLLAEAPHERGFVYHWLDLRSGARRWQAEASSIDTALMLAGALTARQCFADDPTVVEPATRLFERVDFRWMLNGHETLLSMGWRPESGFVAARWDRHFEQPLLVLLGIGSPTHPLPPRAWSAWPRETVVYAGLRYVAGASPLFIHQFSQAFVDFRGRRDSFPPHVDYFENSVTATLAQHRFCQDLRARFPGYGPLVWGLSASDSARGYVAWGGPPAQPELDGTVVPYAVAGSLPFTPRLALRSLRHLRARFGARIYGRYGFVDAFHPTNGWTGPDVIGIDVGLTLLSAENLRSGRVWSWFMANEELPRALALAGLTGGARPRR